MYYILYIIYQILYIIYVCVISTLCECMYCVSLRGCARDSSASLRPCLRACSRRTFSIKNKNFWTLKWGVKKKKKIPAWNENRILPRQLFDQIFFQNLKIIKTNSLNNSRKNKKEEKILFLFFKYLHNLYNHRFSIKFYFFFFLLSKPIYLP